MTGASRGIGLACARALGQAGARVAMSARSAETLRQASATVPGAELEVPCDLAADGAAADAAARVLEHFAGQVDILVNNAGVVLNRRTARLREADVDAVLRLNVRAALMLSATLAPSMQDRGTGSIVNVGSINGWIGLPFSAAYAASKSALDGLTRACAAEWGPYGVRVNAIRPGVIDTDMWADGRKDQKVVDAVEAQVALRRWGTAEDVADVVVFLASDASRYLTGQILAVDGGLADTRDLLPRTDLHRAVGGAAAASSGDVRLVRAETKVSVVDDAT